MVEAFEETPPNRDAYRAVLERSSPITGEYLGPAFVFPERLWAAAGAVVLTTADRSSLEMHFDWAIRGWDYIQPIAVALEDGVAMSICHSPAATDRAAEAGVFTVEAARGRGHAVDVVSSWARALRVAGRLPMYSTSWENGASLRVAGKLELTLTGEDFHLL